MATAMTPSEMPMPTPAFAPVVSPVDDSAGEVPAAAAELVELDATDADEELDVSEVDDEETVLVVTVVPRDATSATP